MSFDARFDLPLYRDEEFEECDNCYAKTYCHKISYCVMEENE